MAQRAWRSSDGLLGRDSKGHGFVSLFRIDLLPFVPVVIGHDGKRHYAYHLEECFLPASREALIDSYKRELSVGFSHTQKDPKQRGNHEASRPNPRFALPSPPKGRETKPAPETHADITIQHPSDLPRHQATQYSFTDPCNGSISRPDNQDGQAHRCQKICE
jgi:hypothetical protein